MLTVKLLLLLTQVETKYVYSSVTFVPIKMSHSHVAAVGDVVALSVGAHECIVLVLDDSGQVKSTKQLPGV